MTRINEVVGDHSLHLDMFAYDLNEPDLINILLKLGAQGRMRIVLDDAALRHSKSSPKPEDQFEKLFIKARHGKDDSILRGKFGRYAHDKILIVSKGGSATTAGSAIKVLTGSTNSSVTGFYVNSNHVIARRSTKSLKRFGVDDWKELYKAIRKVYG